MRCTLFALAAFLALSAPGRAGPLTTGAPGDLPVRVEIAGDSIRYSVDRRRATLAGNVQVYVWAPGYMDSAIVVLADRVTLEGSTITAPDGARLTLGPALLRGEDLWFDAATQQFRLARPTGTLSLAYPGADPQAPIATVYFSGAEISRVGPAARVSRAHLTTCDRDKPHYDLSCREVTYDPVTGRLAVRNVALRLYGMTIPLAPSAKVRLGGPAREPGLAPPTPGYSSSEGLYLQHSLRLTDEDDVWNAATALRLSRRQGVTGVAWAAREAGPWDVDLRVGRREEVADNVSDRLALSRTPEVTFRYHLFERDDPRAALDFSLSLGDFREDLLSRRDRDDPPRPRVHERRALGALSYVANASQQRLRTGDWYGATGRMSTYSSDDTFGDLELFAGVGGRLAGTLTGHATVRHHLTRGATPFLFDDVDIKTELQAGLSWALTDRWGLDGWGRYDLEGADMMDYQVGFSYRAHCLTWGLYYRNLGSRIGLRVDLNGLTGAAPAPAQAHADDADDADPSTDRGKEM